MTAAEIDEGLRAALRHARTFIENRTSSLGPEHRSVVEHINRALDAALPAPASGGEESLADVHAGVTFYDPPIYDPAPASIDAVALAEECGAKVYSCEGEVVFFRWNFHQFIKRLLEHNALTQGVKSATQEPPSR